MNSNSPLKAFRESQVPPMSQKAFGELLGVTPNTVYRWESGNRKVGTKKLQLIQSATGLEPRELRPDIFREAAE